MILLVSGLSGNWLRAYQALDARVGFLTTPRAKHSVSTVLAAGVPWAMDNDCFVRFDKSVYRAMLERFWNVGLYEGSRPLWVTAPDVVADAAATLALFEEWEHRIHRMGYPVALVAQDGLERLAVPWDRLEALFIGGSTDWKLSDAAAGLAREAKRRKKWVHAGRINSLVRMTMMARWGCDSIDGSGFSRWAKTIPQAVRWLRRTAWLAENQPELW